MVTFDVTATAEQFTDALAAARRSPAPVTVTAAGQPVAALLSMETYDSLIEVIASLSDPEAAAVLQRVAADAAEKRLGGKSWNRASRRPNATRKKYEPRSSRR